MYKVTGEATLSCERCAKAQTISLPASVELDGRAVPVLTWWIVHRAQLCRDCFAAQVAADAPGLARNDHRDTARLAALQAEPRSGTWRRRVLERILRAPATDEEIQHDLAMSGNTQRPRRVELVDGGWVEDSGQCRRTADGNEATVWRATILAREWYRSA